jgi:hypothetical protein
MLKVRIRLPGGKAVVVDQVLPDGDGVAPTRERARDDLAIGLAGARARARPGDGGRTGSVDTPSLVIARFAPRSVDTSSEMAAFAFDSLGRPRLRTAMPAAFR